MQVDEFYHVCRTGYEEEQRLFAEQKEAMQIRNRRLRRRRVVKWALRTFG